MLLDRVRDVVRLAQGMRSRSQTESKRVFQQADIDDLYGHRIQPLTS